MKKLTWSLVILVPLVIIGLAVQLLCTNLYMRIVKGKFEEHEIIFEQADYDYASERTIGYLNYKYDDLDFKRTSESDEEFYSENDKSHMADVKTIFTGLRIIALVSLSISILIIAILVYQKEVLYLYRVLRKTWIVPAIIAPVLAIVFLVPDIFDFFWSNIFHAILFASDENATWVCSADSLMCPLVPMGFWALSGGIILGILIISIILISVISNNKYIKKLKTI